MRRLAMLAVLVFLGPVTTGCANIGACLGTNGLFGHDYCYNDFDSGECSDYDKQGVNDADWSFHGGKTCSDLGYAESG